jgi:hypothetical protein
MPTYFRADRFIKDWELLEDADKARFRAAVAQFIEDLDAGGRFRKGLRVKGVQGAKGVYELTWAPDGRATWEYGEEVHPGEPHIVWRRIGTHDIFTRP